MLDRPNEAIVCFYKQAVIEPLCADPHVNIAQCYKVMGRLIDAIEFAESALGLDENCAGAYEERGMVMCILKQFSHAVFDFWNALKISKDAGIVENLHYVVSQSSIFKPFAKDCLLAQNGEITVDELVSRMGNTIKENL